MKLLENDGSLRDMCATNLRTFALAHFGQLAQAPGELTEAALTPPNDLPEGSYGEWRRAVAEELLLLAQVGCGQAGTLARGFMEERPFRDPPESGAGPTLGKLLHLKAAAVVLPVDTGGTPRPGTWMHLWLVRDASNKLGADDRGRLEGASEWLEAGHQDCKLFVITKEGGALGAEGHSWQLGAALAARALETKRGDYKVELAARWIVTGRVDGDKVWPVGFGNKTSLARQETKRKWLLPASNMEAPEGHSGDPGQPFRGDALGRWYVASTVEAAWRQVTNEGTVDTGRIEAWPRTVPIFHAFVAEALGPLLVSILQSRPAKLVLWCSAEMEHHGEGVELFLQDCVRGGVLATMPSIRRPRIPSGNIAQAEAVLAGDATLMIAGESPVLFNFTSGNLLMRLAVVSLAQYKPHVRLIYRDRDDDTAGTFSLLHYPHERPETRQLEINWDPPGGVCLNWNNLLSCRRLRNGTARAYADQALEAAEINGNAPTGAARKAGQTRPFLLGNTFPVSLMRHQIRVETRSLGELKGELKRREWVSFWGHENTLGAAEKALGVSVRPKTPRPPLSLDSENLPTLEGRAYDECWVLSPENEGGARPGAGAELFADQVRGWRVLCLKWVC
jgi:hypothetical protein